MSTRTLLVGMLAIAAGAAAAVGARQLVQQWDRPQVDESVKVLTVAMQVPRGEKLTREQLNVEDWPNDHVPDQAMQNVDDALGRVVLAPMYKGQPVYESLLAAKDTPAGLASLVPDGKRAFTIHTPTIASGVAGFVLPGNYVDVLLTVNSRYGSGPGASGVTVTLLQRVEILAVDQNLDAPTEKRADAKSLKSVTLLVSPEQAGKLSLAQNKGVLELALRNPGDVAPVLSAPITIADLEFLGEPPAPEEPAESNEEIVDRLLAERMAQREAEQSEARAERDEAFKAEVRKAVTEEMRRELAAARAAIAKSQVTAPPSPTPKQKPVLRIRTLRGTHNGVVLVKTRSGTIDEGIAKTSDE